MSVAIFSMCVFAALVIAKPVIATKRRVWG